MQIGQIAAFALAAIVVMSGATVALGATDTTPNDVAEMAGMSNADGVEQDGNVNLTVDRNVTPGEMVTVSATLDGEPVRFAPVSVNGDVVGETDENGTIAVSVPDDDEFEVELESEAEGERTIPPESDADEEFDTDGEKTIDISVDGNVSAGENVTITALHQEYPLAGAHVSINGDDVGETNSTGSVTTMVPDADEFEIEIEYEAEGELEIPLEADDVDDESDDDRQIDLIVEGTLEPGETLTVTAMDRDSTLSNATVMVNDERVGHTDANGTLSFEVPQDDELEIEVFDGDREAELTVDFEDAEDDTDDDDDDDDAETDDNDEDDEDEEDDE